MPATAARPILSSLLVTLLMALAIAAALRFGLLQSELAHASCSGAELPWWCHGRSALGWSIHYQLFGWLGLGAALAGWWRGGRRLALFGLAASLFGLLLYNAGLAAFGFVLALVRALRP